MAPLKYTPLLVALFSVSIQAKLQMEGEWSHGFHATVQIPITKEIKNGWEVKLVFDQGMIVYLWPADFKAQADDIQFTFVNKFWDADLKAGSTLELRLIVMKTKVPSSITEIYFNGEPVDISTN